MLPEVGFGVGGVETWSSAVGEFVTYLVDFLVTRVHRPHVVVCRVFNISVSTGYAFYH